MGLALWGHEAVGNPDACDCQLPERVEGGQAGMHGLLEFVSAFFFHPWMTLVQSSWTNPMGQMVFDCCCSYFTFVKLRLSSGWQTTALKDCNMPRIWQWDCKVHQHSLSDFGQRELIVWFIDFILVIVHWFEFVTFQKFLIGKCSYFNSGLHQSLSAGFLRDPNRHDNPSAFIAAHCREKMQWIMQSDWEPNWKRGRNWWWQMPDDASLRTQPKLVGKWDRKTHRCICFFQMIFWNNNTFKAKAIQPVPIPNHATYSVETSGLCGLLNAEKCVLPEFWGWMYSHYLWATKKNIHLMT